MRTARPRLRSMVSVPDRLASARPVKLTVSRLPRDRRQPCGRGRDGAPRSVGTSGRLGALKGLCEQSTGLALHYLPVSAKRARRVVIRLLPTGPRVDEDIRRVHRFGVKLEALGSSPGSCTMTSQEKVRTRRQSVKVATASMRSEVDFSDKLRSFLRPSGPRWAHHGACATYGHLRDRTGTCGRQLIATGRAETSSHLESRAERNRISNYLTRRNPSQRAFRFARRCQGAAPIREWAPLGGAIPYGAADQLPAAESSSISFWTAAVRRSSASANFARSPAFSAASRSSSAV